MTDPKAVSHVLIHDADFPRAETNRQVLISAVSPLHIVTGSNGLMTMDDSLVTVSLPQKVMSLISFSDLRMFGDFIGEEHIRQRKPIATAFL